MKNETSFEIRAYIKGSVGLNVLFSQIYIDFLKEENVVQLSHPHIRQTLVPVTFFLFPLLKKTLSGHRYESRSALGSAIY